MGTRTNKRKKESKIMNTDTDLLLQPTTKPLIGKYNKIQIDTFHIPIRLYNKLTEQWEQEQTNLKRLKQSKR